jgi:hypothetical protein
VDIQIAAIVFSDGVSLGPGKCKVIAVPEAQNGYGQDPPNSLVLDWSPEKGMVSLMMDHPLTRIVLSPESESEVMVCSRLGSVGLIRGNQVVEEDIEGPENRGFICDVRVIGQHAYVAGMDRQVYRRVGSGRWERFEKGIDTSWKDILDVAGFNAIDGLSEDDVYAVGYKGDIWHCTKGEWRSVASPTNLIIERVRTVKPDLVFAAGRAGLLLRGHDDRWESVNHDVTRQDFWGLEWFQDRLYLATSQGLFRLTDSDDLEGVDDGFPKPRTYSQLHASNGALWSFGPRHLSWTTDGETWSEVLTR